MADHLRHLIGYPFPLGDGTFGYVYLPAGISSEDARRLAAMAASLVFDPDEVEGSPPPTPAPTRELLTRAVRTALVDDAGMPGAWFPDEGNLVTKVVVDAVMALLSTTVLWEQETRPTDGDPAKSYIAPPLLDCPPGTTVAVVERTALANASPPAPDPGAFDAEQLVVILGLADLDPLERAGEPPVRCALCGAEAPGGATTLAPSQHLGGCLWVSARELAKVLRAKSP